MDEQCLSLHAQVSQFAEKLAENRTEHRSFLRRLAELEENGKRQTEILITLQRQADAIESINTKIDKLAGGVYGRTLVAVPAGLVTALATWTALAWMERRAAADEP